MREKVPVFSPEEVFHKMGLNSKEKREDFLFLEILNPEILESTPKEIFTPERSINISNSEIPCTEEEHIAQLE